MTMTTTNLQLTGTYNYDTEIVKADWSAYDPITNGNMDAAYDLVDSADLDAVLTNSSGVTVNTAYTSGALDVCGDGCVHRPDATPAARGRRADELKGPIRQRHRPDGDGKPPDCRRRIVLQCLSLSALQDGQSGRLQGMPKAKGRQRGAVRRRSAR